MTTEHPKLTAAREAVAANFYGISHLLECWVDVGKVGIPLMQWKCWPDSKCPVATRDVALAELIRIAQLVGEATAFAETCYCALTMPKQCHACRSLKGVQEEILMVTT